MTGVKRLGLIGAGLIGRKHAELMQANPDCQIAGIADPAPQARDLATTLNVPWYDDYRLLLERERPDGMIVASPNTLHVPMALDCLERGVPALVEKPIAETVAAARKIVEAVERTGVPVLVGHHRRHNPMIKAVRAAVADGRLGRLTAVIGLWLLKKPDDYFNVTWRKEDGGGPILINLIHDIDNLRFICGDIVEVQAQTSSAMRGFAVEDTAALLFRFASGALGTVTLSDATPSPWSWELASRENPAYPPNPDQPCYIFAGTQASLTVPTLDTWDYPGKVGWYEPLQRTTLPAPVADPLVEQLRHFLAVIDRSETPLVSAADALATLAVIEAVKDAARTGARIAPQS